MGLRGKQITLSVACVRITESKEIIVDIKSLQGTRLMPAEKNVGSTERWISLFAGTALVGYGISRRSASGLGLALVGGGLLLRGATGYCEVNSALGRNTAEQNDSSQVSVPYDRGTKVEVATTIARPVNELYEFWRNFENLPRFMEHLESVRVIDSKRSHWVAEGPAGHQVQWDAEIINEIPDELIAWRSLEGSEVDNAGSVHFTPAPGNRGTEVRVVLKYDPPAGKLGTLIAKLFRQEPSQQIREDLRRLKQILETGEIAVAEATPGERAAAV